MPAALAGVALNTDSTAEAASTERTDAATTALECRFIRDRACRRVPLVGCWIAAMQRNDEAGARLGNRCTSRRPPTTSASSRPHLAACCPESKPIRTEGSGSHPFYGGVTRPLESDSRRANPSDAGVLCKEDGLKRPGEREDSPQSRTPCSVEHLNGSLHEALGRTDDPVAETAVLAVRPRLLYLERPASTVRASMKARHASLLTSSRLCRCVRRSPPLMPRQDPSRLLRRGRCSGLPVCRRQAHITVKRPSDPHKGLCHALDYGCLSRSSIFELPTPVVWNL